MQDGRSEASRVASTRRASIITWSALTGVRCFCSIVTTSVDAQVAMDASSTSKGRVRSLHHHRFESWALAVAGLELKASHPLHFDNCCVRDSRQLRF